MTLDSIWNLMIVLGYPVLASLRYRCLRISIPICRQYPYF